MVRSAVVPAQFTMSGSDAAAAIGIDVGASHCHVVVLDGDRRIVASALRCSPADAAAVLTQYSHAVVAIDGPAGPSAGAYVDDLSIGAKFRVGRGCEVELGRQRAIWVPWVTGPGALSGWMAVAASLHTHATAVGHRALETYPHATFTTLLGRRPPKKTTPEGRATRRALLRAEGVDVPEAWGHDGLDATAAALVAHLALEGTAVAISSERDGTSVWLPR